MWEKAREGRLVMMMMMMTKRKKEESDEGVGRWWRDDKKEIQKRIFLFPERKKKNEGKMLK